jgi:formate/nitrite transporter FocA (FNT family)
LSSSEADHQEADKRTAIGAHVVLEAVSQEGEEELKRSSPALAWSGLAAGLSMGFSLVAQALLNTNLPDAPWRPLITKIGYTVGFLIVILGRQQLFTENTLTVVLPLLQRKDRATLLQVLRLWAVVLVSNLAGTFLFAWCIGRIDLFEPGVSRNFAELSQTAVSTGFWITVMRGIFAGWLIAMTVWMLPAAEAAKVSIIVIITYLVSLGGFSHVVAGSVEAFYLVVVGKISIAGYFTRFLAPTLIGNILGGVSLVAALNHAQVVSGDTNS